jgi:hypothetical protein
MVACRQKSLREASMERAQSVTQGIRAYPRELMLGLGVCRLPQRVGSRQQPASGRRQGETAAAPVLPVDGYLEEAAPFERFEVGGECRAVHREQRRNTAEARRLRAIERHQQRELAIGEIERPEHIVEMPRQRTSRTMDVQAQAAVAHHMGRGKRERIISVVRV